MHWMIKCRSKPNTDELRKATIEAHKRFLDGYREVTWFSGPIFTDDGKSAIGSLRFIEFPDRETAKQYIDADPYATAGIFETVDICRWQPGLNIRQLTYPRKDGAMQFVFRAVDAPDSGPLRDTVRNAHRDYLDAHAGNFIARGPLMSDDGETVIGSAGILEVADREAAEALWADEPFNRAGVYQELTIERWLFGHV